MLSPHPTRSLSSRRSERGYILITLILFVALLAIAAVALAPVLSQQIKRDREDELIHRGVQYTRAIKHYVKKFGRYPTKLEDLESTNNVRFLRKRYKDPITGKDFKILYMGDVQMSFGGGLQGATPVANLAAAAATSASNGNGFGSGNSFGGNSFGGNNGSAFGGGNSFGGNNGSAFGGGNSFGGNNGSAFGGGSNFGGGSSFGGNSTFGGSNGSSFGAGNNGGAFGNNNPGQPPAPGGQAQDTGSDAEPNGAQGTPNGQAGFGQPVQALGGFGQQGTGQNNQVFGGGPIVGVASVSKDKSIRIYNKKDKYYQWQFIYDPSTDTGGLLSTPNQPGMQQTNGLGPGVQAGQQGTNQNGAFGNSGSPFGNSGSPFGGGLQNGTPNSPGGFQPQQPQTPQMPPETGPQ